MRETLFAFCFFSISLNCFLLLTWPSFPTKQFTRGITSFFFLFRIGPRLYVPERLAADANCWYVRRVGSSQNPWRNYSLSLLVISRFPTSIERNNPFLSLSKDWLGTSKSFQRLERDAGPCNAVFRSFWLNCWFPSMPAAFAMPKWATALQGGMTKYFFLKTALDHSSQQRQRTQK